MGEKCGWCHANRQSCCCEAQEKKCESHCWHLQKQEDYDLQDQYGNVRCYKAGGPNRQCCHCGKFESDSHGPFAPKYIPQIGYQSTWTTGTITTYPANTWTTTPATTGTVVNNISCNCSGSKRL
jgi:hypothetical protein